MVSIPKSAAIWIGVCPLSNCMLIFIPLAIKDDTSSISPKIGKIFKSENLNDFLLY